MRLKLDFKKTWTVMLVIYIICSTAFIYGTLRPLNSIALYSFLAVSILLILMRGRVQMDLPVMTYIAYGVIMLLGMLYTPTNQAAASRDLYDYITMAVLAFCVAQYIETEKDLHIIIVSFMLAGFVLALYVYAQYGNAFWDLLKEISESDSDNITRFDGDLANANTISMSSMISVVIASYYLFLTKTKRINKLLCLVVAVFCLIVSMAAASKKSMIILVVSVLGMWLYTFLGTTSVKKMLQSFVILIGVVVLGIYAINTLPLFSTVLTRFESLFEFLGGGKGTTSEVERFSFVEEGLKVWLEHPLMGAGTASSQYYFGVYSHSNPVEILMNSGTIGFIVFYGIYLLAGIRFLRNVSLYKKNAKLSVLFFALFLSVSVCGVAWVYYGNRYAMFIMMTIFSSLRVFGKSKTGVKEMETDNLDETMLPEVNS